MQFQFYKIKKNLHSSYANHNFNFIKLIVFKIDTLLLIITILSLKLTYKENIAQNKSVFILYNFNKNGFIPY